MGANYPHHNPSLYSTICYHSSFSKNMATSKSHDLLWLISSFSPVKLPSITVSSVLGPTLKKGDGSCTPTEKYVHPRVHSWRLKVLIHNHLDLSENGAPHFIHWFLIIFPFPKRPGTMPRSTERSSVANGSRLEAPN